MYIGPTLNGCFRRTGADGYITLFPGYKRVDYNLRAQADFSGGGVTFLQLAAVESRDSVARG